MSVSERKFGTLPTGEEVKIYHLENKKGAYAEVLQYGAILVKMCVPDKNGDLKDVVLGYDDIRGYEINGCFFGAIIGRSGNRIENSRFFIDDKEVVLAENENHNNLHSGPDGFEKKLWEVKEISQEKNSVDFFRISPDGENGFPGEFSIVVKYEFTEENELKIFYRGRSDAATVANMTNHSYFNLAGDPSKASTDNILYVNADYYTPVDSTFMTTGEIAPVKDTPMDFTTPKAVGKEINNYDFVQLKNGKGYDHNWVLNTKGDLSQVAAKLTSPESGITLEVYTNEPGVQVYTGNFLDGTVTGKKGIVYNQRASVCLETQHYPDSPNKADWPSVVLEPGQTYNSECIFKFSVEK